MSTALVGMHVLRTKDEPAPKSAGMDAPTTVMFGALGGGKGGKRGRMLHACVRVCVCAQSY